MFKVNVGKHTIYGFCGYSKWKGTPEEPNGNGIFLGLAPNDKVMIIVGLLRGRGRFFLLSTVHLPWILLICSSFNRENGHPLLTNSNHDSHQAESHSSLGSMRALWGWNGPMGIKLFAKKKMRNLESLPHEWTFQYAKAGMWPNIQCRCVKVLQSGPENQL